LILTSWSHGRATPNKVDNKPEIQKSGLIESWLEVTMYLKIKGIRKRLESRNNIVSKNPKYANDVTKLVNLR
jgi:hypothetical protein